MPPLRSMKFASRFAIAAVFLLPGFTSLPCQALDFQVTQPKGTTHVIVQVEKAGEYKLEIDDAAGFRSPVWTRRFRLPSFEFDSYDAGIVPGVLYYVRLNGAGKISILRSRTQLTDLDIDCATLRVSWEVVGRPAIAKRSGVRWNPATSRWVANPPETPTGLGLYFTEPYLRGALQSAQSCDDLRLYDEISQYYLLMLQQTVPLGVAELRMSPKEVPKSGLMAARTFHAGANLVGDNELGNGQWLYPSAKLLRLISLLPTEKRSPEMRQFASQYTAFLVDEQLLRYLMRPARPAPGGGPDASRIDVWNLTLRGLKGKNVWDTAMSDVDLWLLASTAEVMGAHANDPLLVPLRDEQVAFLKLALETGTALFRSKRTSYPDTRNLRGETVGSATYFNGDYDTHPELAYSGVTDPSFPTPNEKKAIAKISWDISHAYRIPVFLRALYENRKAMKSEFPRIQDLQLLANQYVYRVFNGDFSRPLFRNYLDGNDTWFRVDTTSGFGYPPSQYCDMRVSNRPCMSPGQIIGWGLVAFVNPDLERLERALLRLAFEDSPDAREFRNRHHSYPGPFEVIKADAKKVYGDTLFLLIADNAAMLAK